MKLATSLIVLSCILAAGATIFSVLASLPRYKPQRKRLTLVVILCALLAAGATAAKEILAQPFQSTNGPNGPARMATSTAFDVAIEKLVSKARTHFEAAEDDFKSADYVDAAEEYRRSISAVPTLPAYLNVAISLRWSDRRDDALRYLGEGIQLARNEAAITFEANLLYNRAVIQLERHTGASEIGAAIEGPEDCAADLRARHRRRRQDRRGQYRACLGERPGYEWQVRAWIVRRCRQHLQGSRRQPGTGKGGDRSRGAFPRTE